MSFKNVFSISLIVLFGFNALGQNYESKWTIGLNVGAAMYTNIDGEAVGSTFTDQPIRLNISRYVFKNFTLDAAFATSVLDTQKYSTLDGAVRYDFGTSNDNSVPYVLLGTSIVTGIKTTGTYNLGVGNTFWFFPNYGLNFQLMYKYSPDNYESQRSHFYPTVGVVYSFKSRNMTTRLWNNRY